MMLIVLLKLIIFQHELDGLAWTSTRSAAMANGIIAISNLEGVDFFNSDLKHLNKIDLFKGSIIFVYAIKNRIILIDPFLSHSKTMIVENGINIYEIQSFNPSYISSDRDTLTFIPIGLRNPSKNIAEVKWPPRSGFKLVRRFEIKDRRTFLKGEPMMPFTEGQKRLNFNFKGYWVFEDSQKKLKIINQMDPAVFSEETERFSPIDLPNFVYKTKGYQIVDRIFTQAELEEDSLQFIYSASRILGAYRYDCGFVLCYLSPGYPLPDFTRLAFFDEDWNRYGQVQIIPGRLIGVHQKQGYMITVPNDAWISELRKVDLQP